MWLPVCSMLWGGNLPGRHLIYRLLSQSGCVNGHVSASVFTNPTFFPTQFSLNWGLRDLLGQPRDLLYPRFQWIYRPVSPNLQFSQETSFDFVIGWNKIREPHFNENTLLWYKVHISHQKINRPSKSQKRVAREVEEHLLNLVLRYFKNPCNGIR